MKEVIDNLKWRYAVKKFDASRKLDEATIDKLKEAFNLTATSFGLQPIRLVVVSNDALKEQLLEHSFGQPQVSQASHLLVFCIEKDIDPEYISGYFKRIKQIRGTSDDILDPHKEQMLALFQSKAPTEIQEWAKNQAYLAMGNLLTVCAMLRIDSCPMEGFVPAQYDKVLGLEEKNLSSVLAMPIGYRDPADIFSGFKKVRRKMETSIIDIQ